MRDYIKFKYNELDLDTQSTIMFHVNIPVNTVIRFTADNTFKYLEHETDFVLRKHIHMKGIIVQLTEPLKEGEVLTIAYT